MKAEIKIIGYMNYVYKSDRCVYDTGGSYPH